MITITDNMTTAEACEAMAKELVGRQANYFGGVQVLRNAFKAALANEHRPVQQSSMLSLIHI